MPQLAKHASVHDYDRFGQSWEFFDWDSSVTLLRQRALPVSAELPEPQRRSSLLAAAGYGGRKRGEVQLGRSTLQHSGSSQWLGLWCVPGNAPNLEQTQKAAEVVRQYCEQYGLEPQRAVLRCDGGAASGVRSLQACQIQRIQYLTRLSHYEVFEWPQVQQYLEQARFEPVPDSLCGPRREAAELGFLRLVAHEKRSEEQQWPILISRVLISRFPATESGRGAGQVRGPWHYELFGTSMSQQCWPAPEAVAAYYGRSAQENRFSQEDSRLGLDRIFSYCLAGQHLANAIGLFCWNLGLALGAKQLGVGSSDTGSIEVVASPPASAEMPTLCDPAEPMPSEVSPLCVSPQAQSQSNEVQPSATPGELPSCSASNASSEEAPCSPAAPCVPQRSDPLCLQELQGAPWAEKLLEHPGWNFDFSAGGLLCPKGWALRLHRADFYPQRRNLAVLFRAKRSECSTCPLRSACSSSPSRTFAKELRLTFAVAQLPNLKSPRLEQFLAAMSLSTKTPTHFEEPKSSRRPLVAWLPPRPTQPGPLPVQGPMMLPAVLSQAFAKLCLTLQIFIRIVLPPAAAPPPPYIAASAAERQRRRKTWQQRLLFNRLPQAATVTVEVRGQSPQQPLLDTSPIHSPPPTQDP